MSTDIYQVRVLSKRGDRLTCQVRAFYPRTENDPPPSRTLALQFLWEPWQLFTEGPLYHLTGGNISRKQAEKLGRTAAIGRELAGKDICDGNWIRANVGRFISRVEVRERRWFLEDRWSEVGEGPPRIEAPPSVVVELPETQVAYIIKVTDPQWLAHLRAGMEWKTTAYDRDEKD